jgi:hypothetical protein
LAEQFSRDIGFQGTGRRALPEPTHSQCLRRGESRAFCTWLLQICHFPRADAH